MIEITKKRKKQVMKIGLFRIELVHLNRIPASSQGLNQRKEKIEGIANVRRRGYILLLVSRSMQHADVASFFRIFTIVTESIERSHSMKREQTQKRNIIRLRWQWSVRSALCFAWQAARRRAWEAQTKDLGINNF